MNLSLVGLFSNSVMGISAAYIYSISHGLISAGLFFLVGFIYERSHTRILKYFRGLAMICPNLIGFYYFFTLSNFSFPSTFGFIPEVLIYLSSMISHPI
jgi:NADH:ubiquinone oxidoreductase subunit 4 (subunit M)